MNYQQLKELRYNRLKPAERFIIDIVKSLDKHRSYLFEELDIYGNNNICYFQYDSNTQILYYSDNQIGSVLRNQFGYKYEQINELMNNFLPNNLNIKIQSINAL